MPAKENVMTLISRKNRREFLGRSGALFVGIAVPSLAVARPPSPIREEEKNEKGKEAEEVSPAEDLMREHGLLNRILLIYDEHVRRIERKQDFDPGILAGAADIVKRFVEDYHEKLEENYLFPRFRKAGKLVDLVDVLLEQHQAGRRVTSQIQQLATPSAGKDASRRRDLSDTLQAFIRMYRPHEAREDTVLFPAFHGIVSKNEYDSLGEQFEKKEDELFGKEGFFKVLDEVAGLEKKSGIYELSQFTANAPR
jgi:hemerythrin-like domain-containing protein